MWPRNMCCLVTCHAALLYAVGRGGKHVVPNDGHYLMRRAILHVWRMMITPMGRLPWLPLNSWRMPTVKQQPLLTGITCTAHDAGVVSDGVSFAKTRSFTTS